MRAAPARPSRGLDPISAMSWGGEPVRRDQQGKRLFECASVYPIARQKASHKKPRDQRPAAVGPTSPVLKRFMPRDPDGLREKFAKILFSLSGLTLLGYFNSAQ
jgi:hypothetical protein